MYFKALRYVNFGTSPYLKIYESHPDEKKKHVYNYDDDDDGGYYDYDWYFPVLLK